MAACIQKLAWLSMRPFVVNLHLFLQKWYSNGINKRYLGCDQGILQAFKRQHRYHLLRNLMGCIDNHQEFKLHVLTTIYHCEKSME